MTGWLPCVVGFLQMLMLISVKAGSLGINLVGATRVVLLDAGWNPVHELQVQLLVDLSSSHGAHVSGCEHDGIHETALPVHSLGERWMGWHDSQAVYRAYRIGQQRPVHVYRLLSAGTMEEKVYSRQIGKQSLAARVVDEQQVRAACNQVNCSRSLQLGWGFAT